MKHTVQLAAVSVFYV